MTNETLPAMPVSDGQIASGPPSGGNLDDYFNKVRETGWVRTQDRWCAGVAGGVARRMGWDPTLVRGILFVSTFLTGLGLILYGLAWALLPEEVDGRIHLQEAIRGRFDPALVGAGLLVLMGLGRHGGALSALGRGLAVVSNIVTTGLLVFGAIYLIRTIKERRNAGSSTSDLALEPGAEQASSPGTAPDETPEFAAPVNHNVVAQSVQSDEDLEASITAAQQINSLAKTEAKAAAREIRAQERAAAEQEKAAWRYARAVEKAKTPIVKGPGAAVTGGVFGLILLLGAAAMALNQPGIGAPVVWSSPALWVGGVLALLGCAVIFSGFRGRRGGLLNLLGVLALLAIPAATFAHVVPGTGTGAFEDAAGSPNFGNAMRIVDGDIVQADRTSAELGFQIGFGDPVIDLTQVALSDNDPISVPVSLRAGDLTIIVPEDAAVAANIRLLAGEISWEVDDEAHQTLNRIGRERIELRSEEVRDDAPELSLWIDAGFGNVTIKESQR